MSNVVLNRQYSLQGRLDIRQGLIRMLEQIGQPRDTKQSDVYVELPDFWPKLLHVEQTTVSIMNSIQFNPMRPVKLQLVTDEMNVFWKMSEICLNEYAKTGAFPCQPASVILVAFSDNLDNDAITFMSMKLG